jgi:hypothetical protein
MISLALSDSQKEFCTTELDAVFILGPMYFSDRIFHLDSLPKHALISKEIRNRLKAHVYSVMFKDSAPSSKRIHFSTIIKNNRLILYKQNTHCFFFLRISLI